MKYHTMHLSINLFYLYIRTLVNIFNLVIQNFVNLYWVVYFIVFPSFFLYFSRTYYFNVSFYWFNSVCFLKNFSLLFSVPLTFCYTFSSLSSDFYIDYLMIAIVEWLPTPVFLPGEFHSQRNLVGYSPWSHKESDMTEWLTSLSFLFSESCFFCVLFSEWSLYFFLFFFSPKCVVQLAVQYRFVSLSLK